MHQACLLFNIVNRLFLFCDHERRQTDKILWQEQWSQDKTTE